MNRLKLFNNDNEYDAVAESFEYPTVSYVEDIDEVRYMTLRDKYTREYLTFEALENGTISFNIWYSMGTDMITSISYSTDNGDTWTTTQNVNGKSENLQISVNVEEGDKVLWKGTATQTGYFDEDDWGDTVGSFFSSDCEYNVYGNVMSLLHGDNFYGVASLGNTECTFAYLFYNYYEGESYPIVSTQNLILPATMTNNCYYGMFTDCTSLTTAPELPATTLARNCYQSMFQDCTALTTAPILPATTLANNCYSSMFSGCTSLTTAPVLPATTLARECYYSMFYNCTALTTAPVLPATTMAERCYESMFYGCTSLTTAPVLPALTLAERCYSFMFYNCSRLNYIKAMFTTTPTTSYTTTWVSGVAASGTFVKNSAAQWNVTGNNGVPTGWTIQTESA